MPRNNCCVPGCSVVAEDNVPLHYFPNPLKDTERFQKWVDVIGGEIVNLDNSTIHRTRKVCHRHFQSEYHYPKNRLCKLSVPSLHLTSENLRGLSVPDSQPSTSQDIQIPHPRSISRSTVRIINNKPQALRTTKYKTLNTGTYLLQKHHEKTVKKLELRLRHCLRSKQSFYKRCIMANKITKLKAFEIVAKQLTPAAKSLFIMQVKGSGKKPRGRRFTINEKILALSLYKPSPKAYRLLSKLCILPSRRTLQNILSNVDMSPGINDTIFDHLKKKVSQMPEKYKYCTILFDEMSISANLSYDKGKDKITGFVDNGIMRQPIFCDHVLVFMVRGVVKKYKQPVAFSFCAGTTKTANLKDQIKNTIKKVQSTGLKVVATVCDQGTTNLAAINQLIAETKEKYLQNEMEFKDGYFEVNEFKIVPIYDAPHLIKGVRNNLLNKHLKYIKDGKMHVAKWTHIQDLFLRSPSFRGVKLVHKLTAQHVMPEIIQKMKVKYCTQVFSRSVGVALGCLAESGTLEKESADTAEILLLFDDLFDSVNANYHKEEGKPYRSAVTRTSPHFSLWNSTLPILKSMRFVTKNNKEVSVPSLTSWIKTIEGFKTIVNDLRIKGIKSLLLRNFNQDPLENFFGAIRAHGYRNIMPNAAAFETAYKTLLINNITAPQSLEGNCEKDDSFCLKSLKSFILSTKKSSNKNNLMEASERWQDISTYINMELLDTESILNSHSRGPVEKCAAIAYCSGWVAMKAKKDIFKSCTICQKILISENILQFHNYIKKKEFCGKRWLCYPTRTLFDFFAQVEYITLKVLNNKAHLKDICSFIKSIISIHIDFKVLQMCESHKEPLCKYLLNKSVVFFTSNWCKDVSNVLNGKSFYNFIEVSSNESDEIILQARSHFNKRKGRKGKVV